LPARRVGTAGIEEKRALNEPDTIDLGDHLPVNPRDFLILLALAEGEAHGYGILKEVEEETGGGVLLDPANLYRALKRLMKTGLVNESDKRPAADLDDERRKYYGLTPLGARVVQAEAERLRGLAEVAVARSLIPRSRER
jgi:DNA-binding PadR family transcriptional regulator